MYFRAQTSVLSCVLDPLEKDVGCTWADVSRVAQRDELRQGILSSVPSDCGMY